MMTVRNLIEKQRNEPPPTYSRAWIKKRKAQSPPIKASLRVTTLVGVRWTTKWKISLINSGLGWSMPCPTMILSKKHLRQTEMSVKFPIFLLVCSRKKSTMHKKNKKDFQRSKTQKSFLFTVTSRIRPSKSLKKWHHKSTRSLETICRKSWSLFWVSMEKENKVTALPKHRISYLGASGFFVESWTMILTSVCLRWSPKNTTLSTPFLRAIINLSFIKNDHNRSQSILVNINWLYNQRYDNIV